MMNNEQKQDRRSEDQIYEQVTDFLDKKKQNKNKI